jgi:hypothetical protein
MDGSLCVPKLAARKAGDLGVNTRRGADGFAGYTGIRDGETGSGRLRPLGESAGGGSREPGADSITLTGVDSADGFNILCTPRPRAGVG